MVRNEERSFSMYKLSGSLRRLSGLLTNQLLFVILLRLVFLNGTTVDGYSLYLSSAD